MVNVFAFASLHFQSCRCFNSCQVEMSCHLALIHISSCIKLQNVFFITGNLACKTVGSYRKHVGSRNLTLFNTLTEAELAFKWERITNK